MMARYSLSFVLLKCGRKDQGKLNCNIGGKKETILHFTAELCCNKTKKALKIRGEAQEFSASYISCRMRREV